MTRNCRFFIPLILIALSGFVPSNAPFALNIQKYWIYFIDKGPQSAEDNAPAVLKAKARLSERALLRRSKRMATGKLIQYSDLDLYQPYLDRLASQGIEIVVKSRWLNAVSARLTPEQLEAVRRLPFVARINAVQPLAPPTPQVDRELSRQKTQVNPAFNRFDYGESFQQNQQINVPILHDTGIFGEHVIVGMLDSGFRPVGHEAFDSLEVLGEFDFIFGDSVTSNQPGDVSSQDNHGTQTLSVIAGFAPGRLIGPAFKAKFYLSKTEHIPTETRVEEDNWVAAIEWMEAQGIDIASSSLGYRDFFDDPAENYSYQDLDGKTAVVTRAAQMATEKGVVVVTSAGNEGNSPTFPYIGAPADAPDVLAVGAVTPKGERASFSSTGPTFDGRIKPDVMAMGTGVTMVTVGSTNGYSSGQGTSFSCPLVAGVAALMLSAHPELTPLQVNEALRMTASQATRPDNFMGYGLVDARQALTYWGPAFSNRFTLRRFRGGVAQVEVRCLVGKNETIKSLDLHWRVRGESSFRSEAMQQVDSTLFISGGLPGADAGVLEVYFTTQVPAKGVFTYPYDAPGTVLDSDSDAVIIDENRDFPFPEKFTLTQSYPNPFAPEQQQNTLIRLSAVREAQVTIRLFNVLGQEILRLAEGVALQAGGARAVVWDGRDARGKRVPSGIYFYQAEFQSTGETIILRKKLAVIR